MQCLPPPPLPPTIYRQPPLYGLPPSILLENLDSPCDFSKILTPPINKRAWGDGGFTLRRCDLQTANFR